MSSPWLTFTDSCPKADCKQIYPESVFSSADPSSLSAFVSIIADWQTTCNSICLLTKTLQNLFMSLKMRALLSCFLSRDTCWRDSHKGYRPLRATESPPMAEICKELHIQSDQHTQQHTPYQKLLYIRKKLNEKNNSSYSNDWRVHTDVEWAYWDPYTTTDTQTHTWRREQQDLEAEGAAAL